EGEDGETRRLTYGELASAVRRFAAGLRALGVRAGDRVGIFLPMIPECAIATLAVSAIGAIYTPIFSGYAAEAIAGRLRDCEASVLITADGFRRRGQVVRMKETADAAADRASARTVIVVPRLGCEVRMRERDVWWDDVVASGRGGDETFADVPAEHPYMIIYTSGTTGRPMRAGEEPVRAHDRSSLFVLGSTGEPWNPEPWWWYFGVAGERRAPLVNYSGGTEVSGGLLGCTTWTPIKPTSFSGPVPGIAADVCDESGRSVRGAVGELVVRKPWPGMTRGFWRAPEHYLASYWRRFPDVWVQGDWARTDDDEFWYIDGRSDDTMKVAGKRVGPAEVESAATAHPAVLEAAAIGVPHDLKGEAVIVFAVLRPGCESSDALASEIADKVMELLGRPLRPDAVRFVSELPKTRNAKVLRRVIRGAYLGQADLGDLSALENPAAVDRIRELVMAKVS